VVETFDLVVIGAGPAGEKGAAQAAYFGRRVAIVENQAQPGGAAAINAWVPSKTLREAALYLTGFQTRDAYEGLSLGLDPKFAVNRLRSRAAAVVKAITGEVRTNIEAHGIELVHGTARLAPDKHVHVTTPDGSRRDLRGDAILIASGSRPFHPAGIDFDDADVVDSETVLDIDVPLESIVVIGGGAVGTEYSSIFRALGTRVTLVDARPRLIPMMDHDISDGLADALRRIGARVELDAGAVRVGRDRDGVWVKLGSGEVARPEKVLFAAGRTGNTESLATDEAGVGVDERGWIKVDESYQTSATGIYAAGDVIGPPALASVSMEQARVAVCHAFGIPFKEMVTPVVPTGVYSIPEAGAVGLTEAQVADAGVDYEIGIAEFARNSRAIISGTTEGFVKLVFLRADRRVLGVHILGPDATELVHQGQAVISHDGTIDAFIEAVYNVPTMSETYKYAAYDGLQRLARRSG